MGDRLKFTGGKRKKDSRRTTHGIWQDGAVQGRMLTLPGGRVVLIAWHGWTKMALASWSMSAWEYESLRDAWEEDPMSKFLKKAKTEAKKDDGMYAAKDAGLAKDHPAIVEYMTLRKHDDGTARIPSSLLFFCEDGQWKACLCDRDEEKTLWASAETLQELLEALEAILQGPSPQWRTKKGQRVKKGS